MKDDPTMCSEALHSSDSSRPGLPAMWVMGVLVLAAIYFLYRGPWRASSGMGDYMEIYSAARAWRQGADPYDLPAVQRVWMTSGVPADYTPGMVDLPSLYPPSALVLFSPFSLPPWREAQWLWLGVNLSAMGAILICATAISGLRWGSTGQLLLTAGLLAFSPFHTAITMGQPGIIVVALVMAGLLLAWRERDVAAGLLLGLAMAAKPQLAGLFVAYYLMRGRWRLAAVAAGVSILLLIAGVMPLMTSHIAWWSHWRSALHDLQYGGFADFTEQGDAPYKMVNLHYAAYQLLHNRTATTVVCSLLSAALFALGVWRSWGTRGGDVRERLALALMAVVSLIAVYHLFYDAALLSVVIAVVAGMVPGAGRKDWGLGAGGWGEEGAVMAGQSQVTPKRPLTPLPQGGERLGEGVERWILRNPTIDPHPSPLPARERGFDFRLPALALLMMAPFLIPGAVMLAVMQQAGRLPQWLTGGAMWRAVILPHQCWALLLLALLLSWRLMRRWGRVTR
ncbi:MAG: glycosyltransferase family 87 protein [Phycisphaerales bacterium]